MLSCSTVLFYDSPVKCYLSWFTCVAWSIKHFQHLFDRKGKDREVIVLTSFCPFFAEAPQTQYCSSIFSSLCWNSPRLCTWKPQVPSSRDLVPLHLQGKQLFVQPWLRTYSTSFHWVKRQNEVYILQLPVCYHMDKPQHRVSYHLHRGCKYAFHVWFTFFFQCPRTTHLIVNHFQILDYANSWIMIFFVFTFRLFVPLD